MKRTTVFRLILINGLLLGVLGCNLTDALGGGNSEEKAPTSPVVVYVTANPGMAAAPVLAPTITPPAPTVAPASASAGLTVVPCPTLDDCPGAVSARDFYDVGEPPFEYTFDIPAEIQLAVGTGWSAIDPATLLSNLTKMDFFFEIDGQDYYSDLYTVTSLEPDQDDPTKLNGVFYLNVGISGWVPHQLHTIRIGYDVTAPINDGWDDYAAGFKVEKILHVCPDGGCPIQ